MNQNDFPRMLYQAGGPEEIHGGRFSTLIVQDADELDAALAGGWHMTTPEATEAAKPAPAPAPTLAPAPIPDGEDPPTRDELKAKATELGLTFAGNISNAKLAKMIEAKLADADKPQE